MQSRIGLALLLGWRQTACHIENSPECDTRKTHHGTGSTVLLQAERKLTQSRPERPNVLHESRHGNDTKETRAAPSVNVVNPYGKANQLAQMYSKLAERNATSLSVLSREEIKEFGEEGYVVVSGIFSDSELDNMVHGGDDMVSHLQAAGRNLDVEWGGSWADGELLKRGTVMGVHSPQEQDSVFLRAMGNEKLGQAFADLIGTNKVAFHHMKYHLKPQYHGGSFPMHQDRPFFPFKHDSMVGAFIHLDDAEQHNGGLSIIPRSHRLGNVQDAGIGGWHYVSQSKYPINKGVEIKARKGDVAFFHYMTIHGSYPNTSPHPRRALFVQAYDAFDEPLEEQHIENGLGFLLHG